MTVQSFQPADLTPMSAAVNLPTLPAEMAAIVQWANTAGAAQALVERIVDTPFMPAAFWPKFDPRDREAAQHARQQAIASGTAAVLYGGPLGLNPLQSLANIHVVKGKPGLPAELMVALVRSHGHEFGIEEITDHRCRVWGRRADSDEVHRAEFTMERAKKAGYTSQNQKYGTDPQAMLYARAASILCRQMASEVLKGLATVEDLTDEPDADAATLKGTRAVKRAEPTPAPAPAQIAAAPVARVPQPEARAAAPVVVSAAPSGPSGPPLPGEDEPSPERAEPEATQVPAGQIGEDQWRAINAAFVKLGVTGPGQSGKRLAVLSYLAEHTIAKGSDLTANEAAAALDALTAVGAKALVAEVLTQPEAEQPEQPAEAPAPVEAEQDLEPPADDPWRDAPQVQA